MGKQHRFLWLGSVAPAVYFFAVVLGGWLWEGYSHVRQPISELTMASAPNLAVMRPLFLLYNAALLGFSAAVYQNVKNVWLKVSAISLLLIAIAGVMMIVFPQDPIGSKLTTSGLLHLVSAGIAALCTIVAIFSGGFGMLKAKGSRKLWRISILLGSIVVLAGGMAPLAMAKLPDYFGLFERATIFSFIIWVFIFAQALKNIQKAEKTKTLGASTLQ